MKSKNLKKIKLNKKVISALAQEKINGGHTTIIKFPPHTTLCTTWCADTIDDNTCGYCTIA
ncbi:hypothetical protein [Kordia jejudonensis]|uniref:hypothetical protein n=1 Tax=Kordia jejudonensis TaxID=1348245 RepID=UPI0006299C79|nr:hypothetical protein [Kordia jejudonensis]